MKLGDYEYCLDKNNWFSIGFGFLFLMKINIFKKIIKTIIDHNPQTEQKK